MDKNTAAAGVIETGEFYHHPYVQRQTAKGKKTTKYQQTQGNKEASIHRNSRKRVVYIC
jgi:hypothetical protein